MPSVTRRSFLRFGTSAAAVLVAAPIIVRAASLMPVRTVADLHLVTNPYWSTDRIGGFLYSDDLADVIRAELRAGPRFAVAA